MSAQEAIQPEQTGTAEQALLDDLPVVQTAALYHQTLQEAPANVTVITAAKIRNTATARDRAESAWSGVDDR